MICISREYLKLHYCFHQYLLCVLSTVKLYTDGMTAADVGLKPNMQIFREQNTEGFPQIEYIRVHECEKFSVCERKGELSSILNFELLPPF